MSKLRNIPALLSQHRIARTASAAVGVAAVGLAAACSTDRLAAPEGGTQAAVATTTSSVTATSSGSTLASVTALTRTTPVIQSVTASIRLYRQGGTLVVPTTGLTVVIPRSAIGDTAVTITVTALPGKAVAYDFQPHGTKFSAPLQLKQSLAGTSWEGNTGYAPIQAGYFADAGQVNTSTGAATINERISASVSGNTAQFGVSHFSGYLVSWGAK